MSDSIESKLDQLIGRMEGFNSLFTELRGDSKAYGQCIAAIKKDIDAIRIDIRRIEEVDRDQFNCMARKDDIIDMREDCSNCRGEVDKNVTTLSIKIGDMEKTTASRLWEIFKMIVIPIITFVVGLFTMSLQK